MTTNKGMNLTKSPQTALGLRRLFQWLDRHGGSDATVLSLDRVIAEIPLDQAFGVLSRLASQNESGFGRGDAEQLHSSIGALTADEDVLVEPWVQFQGTRVPFVVNASRTSEGFKFL